MSAFSHFADSSRTSREVREVPTDDMPMQIGLMVPFRLASNAKPAETMGTMLVKRGGDTEFVAVRDACCPSEKYSCRSSNFCNFSESGLGRTRTNYNREKRPL